MNPSNELKTLRILTQADSNFSSYYSSGDFSLLQNLPSAENQTLNDEMKQNQQSRRTRSRRNGSISDSGGISISSHSDGTTHATMSDTSSNS